MLMIWDELKREENIRKHRMDFADARDRFEWATALITVGHAGPTGKPRHVALGLVDARLVVLVFSLLGHGSDLGHQPSPRQPQRKGSI